MTDIAVEVVAAPAIEVTVTQAGAPGMSAYQHAVANGFVGTVEEWLESLDGDPGADGAAGADGADGLDGADGREVELQKSATHIQWRYVGDVSWTNVVALADITGADGADGSNGADGANGSDGADGKTWHNGTGAPAGGLGVDGDFYLDAAADAYYGPKTAGAWGSPTSLVGPAGADGNDGAAGADGDDGAPGVGVPIGGTAGQVLAKNSGTDYDTEWIDPPAGGGGSAQEVRHDSDATYSYLGVAPVDTAEGSTGWTVTRITLDSPPVVETGSGTWTGRAGLSYS